MSRFKNGYLVPDICPRRHPQATHKSSTQIGDNISIEVGKHKYVELMRSQNELCAQVIHNSVFELNVRISLGNIPSYVEEQTI